MSTLELTSKIRELKTLQQFIDDATTEAEAIKDAIKAEMTLRDTNEMIVDVFKVRWLPVKTTRFDTSTFKEEQSALYARYCKDTTSRRFTVA